MAGGKGRRAGGLDGSAGAERGRYQLVVRLGRAREIEVGRLGRFLFPAGYYVYTGSAISGLEQRIARHMRAEKRARWHIDYLLAWAKVTAVRRHPPAASECALSRAVGALPGSRAVARGFGSSDCGCPTHLYHLQDDPAPALGAAAARHFRQAVGRSRGAGRLQSR
jgi:sugar fermentation stimulation protein A